MSHCCGMSKLLPKCMVSGGPELFPVSLQTSTLGQPHAPQRRWKKSACFHTAKPFLVLSWQFFPPVPSLRKLEAKRAWSGTESIVIFHPPWPRLCCNNMHCQPDCTATYTYTVCFVCQWTESASFLYYYITACLFADSYTCIIDTIFLQSIIWI